MKPLVTVPGPHAASALCCRLQEPCSPLCASPAKGLRVRRVADCLPSSPCCAALARSEGASSSGRRSGLQCRALASFEPGSPVSRRSSNSHHDFLLSKSAALFSQVADAIDNGRWSEAAAVLEESVDVERNAPRVPLPEGWPLLRCQVNLLECLLHAGQYSRCVSLAGTLRDQLPQRAWAKPLWVEGLARALMGQRSMAVNCLMQAFMLGVVAEEHRRALRMSFVVAGAFGAGQAGAEDGQATAAEWVAPALPDCRYHAAATPCYPYTTIHATPSYLFVPMDTELEGTCSIHKEWYERQDCQEDGNAWSRTMLVNFMLFGDPVDPLITEEDDEAGPASQL